jgi:hypothetical protein
MVDGARAYSSINDDIFPSKEESSLSGIQPIWYLLKEQSVVRPIKMLPISTRHFADIPSECNSQSQPRWR